MALKILLANQLGGLWSDVTTIGFESLSTPLAWMAAFAYSFQLYFDFWGYSLMAIGIGRMLGFHLPENFRCPYLALSMTEFWRRWHIPLGTSAPGSKTTSTFPWAAIGRACPAPSGTC